MRHPLKCLERMPVFVLHQGDSPPSDEVRVLVQFDTSPDMET